MNVNSISTEVPVDTAQLKRTGAAKDFEALLVSQMLRSVREESSGWLGTEDQSTDAAFGLGEQELGRALAASGGFGMAKLIDAGLKAQAKSQANAQADAQTDRAKPDDQPVKP